VCHFEKLLGTFTSRERATVQLARHHVQIMLWNLEQHGSCFRAHVLANTIGVNIECNKCVHLFVNPQRAEINDFALVLRIFESEARHVLFLFAAVLMSIASQRET
jgi:hypothetical protein